MIHEPNEKILKIYRHHYFPFISRTIEVILGFTPGYVLFYFAAISPDISSNAKIISFMVLTVLFALIFTYVFLIYWLDKLIVTNKKIVLVDWKSLTVRKEYELRMSEIQDVRTHEKGILSKLSFLDYGTLQIDTSSAKSIIVFNQAPDPEGIKRFIYSAIINLSREHNSLKQSIFTQQTQAEAEIKTLTEKK